MGITWLASYPKSGSTWFRAVLAGVLGLGDLDINALVGQPLLDLRFVFDDEVGFESSNLTEDEADRLRPEVAQALDRSMATTLFVKTHDRRRTVGKAAIFPPKVDGGAVYIVRNPLDVAHSFAHHGGMDVSTIVHRMGSREAKLASQRDRIHAVFPQAIGSWSQHVASWIDSEDLPIHVIRFEDMKTRPLATFADALRFASVDVDEDRLRAALGAASFERLQAQELTAGFRERARPDQVFFRRGESGAWQDELTRDQIDQVITDHGPTMRRLGYLDGDTPHG